MDLVGDRRLRDDRRITINTVSGADVDEIFAIRAELETLALRLAAVRCDGDSELLDQLDRLLDRLDQELDHPGDWRTTNEQFHIAIYEAAQSPRLLSIIKTLWIAVEPSLRVYVTSRPSLAQAQDEHRAIVKFLRCGDIAAAEAVLRVHLASTRLVVAALMERDASVQTTTAVPAGS